MSFDVTTLALAKSYADQHGGGGGAGDFIIKMTVEGNDDDGYTVTSCDATVEQIDAAVSSEKRVVVIASYSGAIVELPMLQGIEGNIYYFGTLLYGIMMTSYVYKVDGNTSKWNFVETQIEAGYVDYSNAELPNISTVGGALDELFTNSHTHANKDTLDKLSVSNGKLQYNGSDVGLKGDKGDTGATPNIQIGTVQTLPAESPATASMTGTPESPLLNLGIPRGASGSGGATDEQVASAVSAWLTEHPEAITTVQDGAITTDKLADAAVTMKKIGIGTSTEYENIPYFTGTSPGVGTSAVYGTFGQIIPVKPGKTYYCSFELSTQNITKVQILSAMPEKQYGALTGVLGTLDASDDGAYTIPSDLTNAKAAFFPIKFYFMQNYDDEQSGIDALNNGTTRVNATRSAGNVIQDVPFDVIPSYYGRKQAASMLVDTDKNQVLYASLYAAVSDLVGARVAVLGDSLTEQSAGGRNKGIMDGIADGEYYGDGWFTRIARKYLIKWYCKGYGMQWWYSTDARPNGATKQVRDLIDGTADYDYIILEYGTNDILSGKLGTANDEASETATTTVGAIKWCIEQLQARFPSARIIVIMPCLHNGTDGAAPAKQTTYIDLVDPILRGYSVRRVYMADDSGITKAMMDKDGIHLRNPYVVNDITYYTNDTEAVRRYSKCLEAEMLKA